MRSILGSGAEAPAGIQGAEPLGARRGGGLPGEGRESRGQSPLAPSAEDIPRLAEGGVDLARFESDALDRCQLGNGDEGVAFLLKLVNRVYDAFVSGFV